MDTSRLRAAVFERTGIAIDEHDPIMAVLAVSAEQTEEIGRRLLAKTSPVRVAVTTGAVALLFAAVGAGVAWHLGQRQMQHDRAIWLRQQSDPQRAALLASEEGKAACIWRNLEWLGCWPGARGGVPGESRKATAYQLLPTVVPMVFE